MFLLVALIWLLPTLLFDRATWQRIRWSAVLRRFRSIPYPGWDVDPIVRARLWSTALVACVQALAFVWVTRMTWPGTRSQRSWGPSQRGRLDRRGRSGPSLAVAAALAVGMVPRLLHGGGGDGGASPAAGACCGCRRAPGVGTLLGAYVLLSLGVAASAVGTGGGSDFGQQRLAALLRVAAIPLVLLAAGPDDADATIRDACGAQQGVERRRGPHPAAALVQRRRHQAPCPRQSEACPDRPSQPAPLGTLRGGGRGGPVTRGPVLGVGQVGERLPPALGAVRHQFTNEEWEQRVDELMGEAQLICITLGRTESLAWEIERISSRGFLGKTIFVLPPTNRGEHLKRLAVLAKLLDLNWVEVDPSPSGGWALAVHVKAKGAHPLIIRARAQEDVGYDVALEMVRLSILGWDWETIVLDEDIRERPPPPQIHARGQAPKVKSLWRRPYVLIAVVNVLGLVDAAVRLPRAARSKEPASSSTSGRSQCLGRRRGPVQQQDVRPRERRGGLRDRRSTATDDDLELSGAGWPRSSSPRPWWLTDGWPTP